MTSSLVRAGLLLLATSAAMAEPAAMTGRWGGDRLNLTLTGAGGMVELDCAAGQLDAPVRPGADGRFSVAGRFESFAGGPQRADVAAGGGAARYDGVVDGSRLVLTIHVAATGESSRYTLEQGRTAKLVRCL